MFRIVVPLDEAYSFDFSLTKNEPDEPKNEPKSKSNTKLSENEKFKKVFAQNFLICYNPSLENKKSRCKSSEVRVILRSMTTSITRFLFCRHCLRNKSTPCRHLHEKGEHYDRK